MMSPKKFIILINFIFFALLSPSLKALEQEVSKFEKLPDELLLKIFSYLSERDLLSMNFVNQYFLDPYIEDGTIAKQAKKKVKTDIKKWKYDPKNTITKDNGKESFYKTLHCQWYDDSYYHFYKNLFKDYSNVLKLFSPPEPKSNFIKHIGARKYLNNCPGLKEEKIVLFPQGKEPELIHTYWIYEEDESSLDNLCNVFDAVKEKPARIIIESKEIFKTIMKQIKILANSNDKKSLLFKILKNTLVQTNFGDTVLHKACRDNNLDIIKFLTKNKINLNARDHQGLTPIHIACMENKLEIAKLLIASGARINAKSDNGRTCLYSAGKNHDLQKFLLKSGANINIQDNSGWTLLHIACMFNNFDQVKWLIENGARMDIPDNNGNIPLHHALNKVDILGLLIEKEKTLTFPSETLKIKVFIENGKEITQATVKHGKNTYLFKIIKKF